MRDTSLELIDDAGRFERLRGEWDELLADSDAGSPFLTWEWLFTWWTRLGGGRSLFLVTVRSSGRLIALAPLTLRTLVPGRFRPFQVVEFLGSGAVGSDYLDLIVRRGHEERALTLLAEFLAREEIRVEMSHVRRGASLAERAARLMGERGWEVRETPIAVAPYVPLSGLAWPAYLQGLGPAHRANFARRQRQIARGPEMTFVEAQSEAERREFLRILVELHIRRWDELGGSEAFYLPGLVDFHDEFSALALRRGWLRLLLMRLGTAPAAALYCLRYGGTFYFYQSGFEIAFRRLSVGLVAMGLTIRRALEEGAAEFDFLHGSEDYKSLWAAKTHELARLEAFPPTARGAIQKGAVDWERQARGLAGRVVRRLAHGAGRRGPAGREEG